MSQPNEQNSRVSRLSQWACDHHVAVRGYVMGLVGSAEIADDLAQEVFRRAASARYREEGKARAFLLRIADRLVCDWARRANREITVDDDQWRQVEPESQEPDPRVELIQHEGQQRLAAALEILSESQRRVLLLRYYGDMEFGEIAQLMNCPLNTALSHCRRGLLALRKILVETDE